MVNGPVPLLGSARPHISVGLSAMPRLLNEHGLFQAQGVRTMPDGSMAPVTQRSDYLDAEELLGAIRQIVREEVERALAALAAMAG